MSENVITFLSTIGTVAVILGLLALLVALMERTNRRASGPGARSFGADRSGDRDLVRTLDELRAVRGGAVGPRGRHPRARVL